MVDPVTSGALIGIPISAGFVYLEIGRYAEPQVPRTLFNERKEIFAYTAGLFVGVALAFLFFLLLSSLLYGGLYGTIASLVLLVVVVEGAQVALVRTVYFGSEAAIPFYVLGYRAGAGGILGLGAVAAVANGPPALEALGAAVVEAVAFVLLLVAGGIQSTPRGPPDARSPGAVGRAVILEGIGFFLLAFGGVEGPAGVAIASIAIAGGSAGIYLSRRDFLAKIKPPARPDDTPEERSAGRFSRTDR